MARNASEHRDIPEQILLKYFIKVLNFILLKNIANVMSEGVDAKAAMKAAILRAINKLVNIKSEQPHVLHTILPHICDCIL